ncbi:MAG: YbjN domain-containing protein [Aliishimia sp.]
MKSIIFGLGLAILAGAQPVSAQSVSAYAPLSVVEAMRASGLPSDLTTASNGNPAITAQLDGVTFSVFFYGCTESRNCQDLQLRAVFSAENITADEVNQWNQAAFIGKAYVGDDGMITLEHPIASVDGLSRYSFQRSLLRWKVALDGFRQTLSSAQ